MLKWFVLALALALTLGIWAAVAQDAPTCDLGEARAKAVHELTVIENDDTESLATGLRTVSDDLSAAVAACSDLHWSGKSDWISEPVTIPAGVYKSVTLGFDDNPIIINGTVLSDGCFVVYSSFPSADNTIGEEKQRDEDVYRFTNDCKMLFEVTAPKSGLWEFWFERIQ